MDNSAEAGCGGLSDPGAYADGRVGSLFCRLHADRYSGEVHIESGAEQLTVVFHGGNPVFVEDPSGREALSAEFVSAGLISQADLNEVAAHVGDTLGSCMDMAFCARAVELGRVPAERATDLALGWVRTRILRAMRWQDCIVDLDDSIVVPASLHGWSQPLGPLVYMGVRTFYGQAEVDSVMADDARSTVHFIAPVDAAVDFFDLDEDEAALLASCAPHASVQDVLRRSTELDVLHAWHLLVLLRFAGLVELSAFGMPAETAGDLSGIHAMSQHAAPAAPAVPPPVAPAAPAAPGERAQRMSPLQAAAQAGRARAAGRSASSYRKPTRGISEEVIAPRRSAAPSVSSPPRKRAAVNRLSKELERRRPSTAGPSPRTSARPSTGTRPVPSRSPSAGVSAAPAGQAEAHLKELVRRRMARSGSAGPASEQLDAETCYQRARSEMKRQKFSAAVDMMVKACRIDGDSELYRAYLLWARFRDAGGVDTEGDDATELRAIVREFISEGEHKEFALHAVGHMAYAAEEYDRAEKFLRKALEADRRNRDAERYLKIVQRRRVMKPDEPQKIFGIELTARVGSKKD